MHEKVVFMLDIYFIKYDLEFIMLDFYFFNSDNYFFMLDKVNIKHDF